ncbi:hypothetical protein B0J11DRAFT_579013 [Dendryphion nanum]|uniref:Uncharacterized protein n=1 Tax=Dendryphion nanum TaxID=256645 RepID=A0A9P9IN15_9PLEO|nr:hypothetical protein B0J11DRAFT_579013 [Dendryphion nanum]
MKLIVSLAGLLAIATASPIVTKDDLATSPNPALMDSLLTRRAVTPTPCTPGSQYCGWAMLDGGLNWSPEILRFILCDGLNDCDWNSPRAWNYIWYCERRFFAYPQKLCGGNDSCKGPTARCV